MKILIDIPEDTYQEVLRRGLSLCPANDQSLVRAIRKGIQLPKGHGRLIDADRLKTLYGLEYATKYGNESLEQRDHSYDTMMMYEIADMIDDAPTIIEADKGEEK